ncbi:hypothetical protein SAMN04487991_1533 [Celeribacter neptunius]|uniref:Uncharacterized protein n=1 Tax=Celeribacter neptunius TaxID=588602 RepID=A0A1I3P131_9RHOB|nr:hypothetical protein SAMN04487991_1533 [Celeribacter neptunius]
MVKSLPEICFCPHPNSQMTWCGLSKFSQRKSLILMIAERQLRPLIKRLARDCLVLMRRR